MQFRKQDAVFAPGRLSCECLSFARVVETDPADEKSLKKIVKSHPELERAGIEVTHTGALMALLRNWEKFRNWALIFQGRPNRQQ